MLVYYSLPIYQDRSVNYWLCAATINERFHQEMNNGGSFCSHQFSKQRDVKVFLVPAEGLYYWGSKKHDRENLCPPPPLIGIGLMCLSNIGVANVTLVTPIPPALEQVIMILCLSNRKNPLYLKNSSWSSLSLPLRSSG